VIAREHLMRLLRRLSTRARRPVIISIAPTGAIHTPTMSPHLPVTQEEVATAAVEAAEAGAAVLHLHARKDDGRPTQDPLDFATMLPAIKSATNSVVNLTTGGNPQMTVEERLMPASTYKPELASLNMGSMNFGLYPMLAKYEGKWLHDWEPQMLERSRDSVFKNTYKDIETILEIGRSNGTRFEFECYDTSHLYNLHHFLLRGLVKPPLFVQTVFGIFGGIGGHPDDLAHMKRTADRLFGDQYVWSVMAAGARQLPLVTIGAAQGANVRVGLEDSLWAGPGRLAQSNAEQVRKVREVLSGLSLVPATPDQARELLDLKGADRVGF